MATLQNLTDAITALKDKVDTLQGPAAPVDFQPQVDEVTAIGTALDAKFLPTTPPPTT